MGLFDDSIKPFGKAVNKIVDEGIGAGIDVLGLPRQIPKVDLSVPPPGGLYPSGKVNSAEKPTVNAAPPILPKTSPIKTSITPTNAATPVAIPTGQDTDIVQDKNAVISGTLADYAATNPSPPVPSVLPENYFKDIQSGNVEGLQKSLGKDFVQRGPNGEPLYTNKSLAIADVLPNRGAVTQATDPETIADIMARREASGGPVDLTFRGLLTNMINRRQQKSAMNNITSKANLQKILAETGAIPAAAELHKAQADVLSNPQLKPADIMKMATVEEDIIDPATQEFKGKKHVFKPELYNQYVSHLSKGTAIPAGQATPKEGDIKQFQNGKGIFKNGQWIPYKG